MRNGRVEPARAVHQVERAAQADRPRQPLRAAPSGDQAERGVLIAEPRILGRKHHVAGQRQLDAAGKAKSLHGGDDRQRAGLDTVEHG